MILLIIFVVAIMVSTSCSKETLNNNSGQIAKETTASVEIEKIPYEIPDTYTKEAENITFNTEVIVNPKVLEDGLYYSTATLQEINYDKAYEVLFQDKDTAKKEEYDIDDGKYVSYQSSNNEDLSLTNESLIYLKPEQIYYSHSFSEYEDDYNANLYSTELEFDFASRKEIWNEMKNTMDSIGLNIDGNYTCYALDYETLQKEEYAMGETGKEDPSAYKPNWSAEDNGYFFITHQELQHCTVQYPIEDVLVKVSEQNAPIKFLYTKNGIKLLDIEGVFEFQVSDNYITLMPFEEIANIVLEKYQMLLTETTYEVTKAELYLRPIKIDSGVYDVIPTWQFTIKENATASEGQTYINAITGEEIV